MESMCRSNQMMGLFLIWEHLKITIDCYVVFIVTSETRSRSLLGAELIPVWKFGRAADIDHQNNWNGGRR